MEMTLVQYERAMETPKGRKAIATLSELDTEFKALALDFEAMRNKDIIEFSNQSTFVLGGVEVPYAFVALVATSALVSVSKNEEYNTTSTYAKTHSITDEAWDILRKVQAGKKAQGIDWANNIKTPGSNIEGPLRAQVEASL